MKRGGWRRGALGCRVFIEALLYCRCGGYGNDQEIRLDEDWGLGIWSQSRAADLLKAFSKFIGGA